ncbi:uncharacterized protein [Watersipora subatra]|uniref:uncharacterized protein n=1 Tax=Watersipora subatra TaxID=2589382 RepID=UPI00355BBE44
MIDGRLQHFCFLVDAGGVDINYVNKSGKTPLIAACYLTARRSVTLAMVRKLLQSGAILSKVDPMGQTVLHHAVSQCKLRILELLLDTARTELTIRDAKANTPLHLAVEAQDLSLIRKLVTHMKVYQISSEVSNNDGLTPLSLACQKGRVDIARYLSATVQHSPMRSDTVMHRTGRQWLDTVLFVPYDVDPFTCPNSTLVQLQPKPWNYIENDCKINCITYDWRKTISSGLLQLEKSQRSNSARSVRGISPPASSHQRLALSASHCSSKSQRYQKQKIIRSQKSYMQMLPYFMELKATSTSILPAAQLPTEEERSLSELDGLELCDINVPICRSNDMLSLSLSFSRPRKFQLREKTTKQKISTVQEAISATHAWSKSPIKKRRSVNCNQSS